MNEPYRILFEVIKSAVVDPSDVALDDIMFVAGVSCAGTRYYVIYIKCTVNADMCIMCVA